MVDDETRPLGSPAPSSAPSLRPDELLPPEVCQELARYVAEELPRFGRGGFPEISERQAQLRTGAELVSCQLGSWADRWGELDETTRRLRASQVARQLAPPRPSMLPTRLPFYRRWGFFLPLVALAPLAVWYARTPAVGAGRNLTTVDRARPMQQSDGRGPGDTDPVDRAARVCRTTLDRVVRGATLTIADAEGWVVEFRGLRPAAAKSVLADPALGRFFRVGAGGHADYVWLGEPLLGDGSLGAAHVELGESEVRLPEGGPLREFAATFTGVLVDAYFRNRTRPAYFHLASELTRELGLQHAGLYARCEAGSTHHLGSWFAGSDHHDATTSLMYIMGTYASPPHLAPPFYRPLGEEDLNHGFSLASIAKVTALIDRPLLAALVGREGGMVMGKAGQLTTLTFPYEDGNRASRLSREIARQTHLAE